MDIKLPNGTVIKGIPEGTSKEAIRDKAISAGLATKADFGMKDSPDILGGVGQLAKGLSFNFSDEIAGAVGAIPGALATGGSIPDAYRGIRDAARESQASFEEENPKTALGLQLAGGMLTGGAGAAKTAAAKTLPKLVGTGAAVGGTAALGQSDADNMQDLAIDTGKGAVLGGVLGGALPLAGQGLAKVLSPARQVDAPELLKAGNALGLKTTPAAATGGRILDKVEAGMASNPVTGGAFADIAENNQAIINSLANKSMGVTGSKVDTAQTALMLGDKMRGIVPPRSEIALDSVFRTGVRDIAENTVRGLGTKSKKLARVYDQIVEIGKKGKITGEEYHEISRDLADEAFQASKKSGKVGRAIYQLRDELDEAMGRSLPQSTAKEFKDVRKQWSSLENLAKSNVVSETGDVNAKTLANLLGRQGGKKGRDTSDLYTAAKYMKGFASKTPDSGTSTRLALGGGLGYGAAVDPMITGGLLGGSYLASKAYTSPVMMRYMQNGLIGSVPKKEAAVLGGLLANQ